MESMVMSMSVPGEPEISAFEQRIRKNSKFQHKSVLVHELVVDVDGTLQKLIWARNDFYTLHVDPNKKSEPPDNFMFHVDFDPADPAGEEEARDKVRKAFDKHWGLS